MEEEAAGATVQTRTERRAPRRAWRLANFAVRRGNAPTEAERWFLREAEKLLRDFSLSIFRLLQEFSLSR